MCCNLPQVLGQGRHCTHSLWTWESSKTGLWGWRCVQWLTAVEILQAPTRIQFHVQHWQCPNQTSKKWLSNSVFIWLNLIIVPLQDPVDRWSLSQREEHSIQFSSVTQSCPTLCNPMNRSTPGLPVHHQLLEFTHIHVHRVGDAIQPSHPLSSPFLPAPNSSQHQSLFQWANSSHEVAKVLEFQL